MRHLVRLSVIGADQPGSAALRFGANHQRLERIVRESGIPWTFLRPNSFMQNCLGQAQPIAHQGAFYSPLSPAAKVSHIDAGDIGTVAAQALTGTGHEGQAYMLTGPEALNDDDIAAQLSAVLGREIKHIQIPMEATRAAMLQNGVPEWVTEGIVELYTLYESGAGSGISPAVQQVLGRLARSFADFVRDNRTVFGG